MVKQWEEGWECPECHLIRKADGYDPCLGKLPGVNFACCGHGGKGNGSVFYRGYISFTNGKLIRFDKITEVEG